MRYSTVLFATSIAISLTAPPAGSRAEFIPWKYDWSRSPAVITADPPGTGSIHLTEESLKSASGSSDIVATNIKIFSSAPPQHPDRFTEAGYTLTLFLLDEDSSNSGTLAFTGKFNGTITKSSANLKNAFTGLTTQSLVLGANLYTVTIGPFTPPGPPSSTNSGAVGAHASVDVRPIQKTPEPSTLVLACISFPVMGFAVWWKKRRLLAT